MDIKYNESALKAMKSPDDLEKTIRIPAPRAWIILVACTALMIGLLSWGLFGTVSGGTMVTGVYHDGKIHALIDADDVKEINVGDTAALGDSHITVEAIAAIPFSKTEAKNYLGSDYLVNVNMSGEWGVIVTLVPEVSTGLTEGDLVTFHLSAALTSPISYILGGFR